MNLISRFQEHKYDQLQGSQILTTGLMPCDRPLRHRTWTPTNDLKNLTFFVLLIVIFSQHCHTSAKLRKLKLKRVRAHLLTDIKWPRKVFDKVKLRTSVGDNFISWKGLILHPEMRGSGFGTSLNEFFPWRGPLKSGDNGLSSVNNSAASTCNVVLDNVTLEIVFEFTKDVDINATKGCR